MKKILVTGELGTIGKMDLKSQKISTLVDASYPTKLAVDWITDNVYFIDKFYPNAIRVGFLRDA